MRRDVNSRMVTLYMLYIMGRCRLQPPLACLCRLFDSPPRQHQLCPVGDVLLFEKIMLGGLARLRVARAVLLFSFGSRFGFSLNLFLNNAKSALRVPILSCCEAKRGFCSLVNNFIHFLNFRKK